MSGVRLPAVLAIVAAPAMVVLLGALLVTRTHAFDGLYGQDAFAYVDYALGPLREALLAGRSLPDFPLPPGYPLLVAVASLATGPFDGLGQAVSLIAGAMAAGLVVLLTLEIWPGSDRRVALVAGLIAAVSGQLWVSSSVGMSDTAALAAATLGALASCRYRRTGQARWLLLGAAALALAVEIRLVYGVVAAVFAALALGRLRSDVVVAPRRTLALAAGAAVVVLIVLAPSLGPVVGALAAGDEPPFLIELGVARLDLLTPFRTTFDTADGRLEYRFPMAAWYAVQPVQPYWLGALALFIPLGIRDVLRSRPPRAAEASVLLAWPALTALVLVLYPYQNTRFVLAMLPPLAILAACGIAWAWVRLASRPRLQRTGGAVVIALLVTNGALAWRHADAFAARQAADLAAIRSLAAQVPGTARVVSLGATPALRHDGFEVVELYYLDADEVDGLVDGGPTYVLVDATALATQWAGTRPGIAFERLRSTGDLAEVDHAGAWTLFLAGAQASSRRQ